MTTVTATKPGRPTWITATVAGFFGLFYAYMVWNALAFLISRASGTPSLSGWGWGVLLFAVVFPIIVFAFANALGAGHKLWAFALILLSGLGLVAVFWLNVLAYSIVGASSLFV